MSSGAPHPSVDELLDRFIAAWHAGEAPGADAYLAEADPADREELTQLLAAFMELAPTMPATDAARADAASDPLVQQLVGLERAWWAGREATSTTGADAQAAEPWGARLAALRAAAGSSLVEVGAAFAARFGLPAADGERAAAALGELEAGQRLSTGVAARAARALEELLAAPLGALGEGAAPALGAPVLRGELPESADERDQLVDLLRTVDDAVQDAGAAAAGSGSGSGGAGASEAPAERLEDLLGG